MSEIVMLSIVRGAERIAGMIKGLPLEQQVEALNQVRTLLHEASPFSDQPVDLVLWVPAASVVGNEYNPNKVAPPEMRLLERSIDADGYTQPIVAHQKGEIDEVVDGFHRSKVGTACKRIRERVHGYLPVTRIRPGQTGENDRIAATIRHNRARGKHAVNLMKEIVSRLTSGWSDEDIARELGMDADEVLRFRQVAGLPGLFKDRDFSRSWEGAKDGNQP